MDNETLKRYYYKSIVVDFDYVGIHVKYANPENINDDNVRMNIPYELDYLQYYTKPNKESDIILSPLRKVKIDLPAKDSLDITDLKDMRFLFYTKDVDNYNNSTFSIETAARFVFNMPDFEKLYILSQIKHMACMESLQINYIGLDIPRIDSIFKSYKFITAITTKDKEKEKKCMDPYIIIPHSTYIEIYSKRDCCHEDIKESKDIDQFLKYIKQAADSFIQTQPQIPDDEYYSHIAVNVENPDDIRIYYCMTTGRYISRIIDVSKLIDHFMLDILYKQVLSRKTTLRFISRNKKLLDMMCNSI